PATGRQQARTTPQAGKGRLRREQDRLSGRVCGKVRAASATQGSDGSRATRRGHPQTEGNMIMAYAKRTEEILDDNSSVHRGSGDFLVDQGIKDPDEFRVKSHLCHTIASIIEARDLTQQQVADMTDQKQADISRIINSRHAEYSVWRLMKILSA